MESKHVKHLQVRMTGLPAHFLVVVTKKVIFDWRMNNLVVN
jgi:hypothetical protein